MNIENTYCRACDTEIEVRSLNDYAICPYCKSANYISQRTADEDNKDYFNSARENFVLKGRERLFFIFNFVDSLLHKKEIRRFRSMLNRIEDIIISAQKSVEIGFGGGHELVRYLNSGANIYGIDLSEVGVLNFRKTYPQWSSRVFCDSGENLNFSVDVVYSNALFEHLDDPKSFLKNASVMLSDDGFLLMRLPIITTKDHNKEGYRNDINFWRPCHRVLYTSAGLSILMEKHGFSIIESAQLAYYGYAVMNRMLDLGYVDIISIRNPYFKIEKLNSGTTYLAILMQSLFRPSVCSDMALIAKKVRLLQ
jgi:2-polyprenyl-3-methyl-5-hydroxy-6-metoxy-1,4-benzoquinol methylase